MAKKFSEMDMPKKGKKPEKMEEIDIFSEEGEAPEEMDMEEEKVPEVDMGEEGSMKLGEFSDDELLAEMKKRGLKPEGKMGMGEEEEEEETEF